MPIRGHKKKERSRMQVEYKGDKFIEQYNGTEYGWSVTIKTAVKVRHNQPDLLIWKIENIWESRICFFLLVHVEMVFIGTLYFIETLSLERALFKSLKIGTNNVTFMTS